MLKNWRFQIVILEKTLETFGQQGDPNQSILKEINPEYSLEGLCWSWSSNTLATWCEEPTHWKRLWCWKRLKAGEEGDDRGWDGWMASPSQWTWVWANSRRWWREVWRAAVRGITKSLTWLSDWIATIYQNNFTVQQKLTQHCKSTILRLKKEGIHWFL